MGGRPNVVPDEDFIEILRRSEHPFLATSEIAEQVPIGPTGVYKRMREFEDLGVVGSRVVGGTRVWWLIESGEE